MQGGVSFVFLFGWDVLFRFVCRAFLFRRCVGYV